MNYLSFPYFNNAIIRTPNDWFIQYTPSWGDEYIATSCSFLKELELLEIDPYGS